MKDSKMNEHIKIHPYVNDCFEAGCFRSEEPSKPNQTDPRWNVGEPKFDTETWQAFMKDLTVTEYGAFETELNTAMNKVDKVYKKYNEMVAARLSKNEQEWAKNNILEMLKQKEINAAEVLRYLAFYHFLIDEDLAWQIRDVIKS